MLDLMMRLLVEIGRNAIRMCEQRPRLAGSRDAEFLKALDLVSEQALRGNDLVLTLRDGGSMRFATPR